jgi:hypothetical protein
MYKRVPHESWLDKGIKGVEGALRVYGTAKGVWDAGSALASGLRGAYQVAGPALALL